MAHYIAGRVTLCALNTQWHSERKARGPMDSVSRPPEGGGRRSESATSATSPAFRLTPRRIIRPLMEVHALNIRIDSIFAAVLEHRPSIDSITSLIRQTIWRHAGQRIQKYPVWRQSPTSEIRPIHVGTRKFRPTWVRAGDGSANPHP